jgi:hypothetical protein
MELIEGTLKRQKCNFEDVFLDFMGMYTIIAHAVSLHFKRVRTKPCAEG